MAAPCVTLTDKELKLYTDIAKLHAEAGAVDYVNFSRAMIGEFGEDVRPFLMQIYESLRKRKFPGKEAMQNKVEVTNISTRIELQQVLGGKPFEYGDLVVEGLKKMGLDKSILDPTKMEKFVEFATAIKLTGLSTHIRNVGGNSAMLALRVPEKFAAGVLDSIRHAITGMDRTVYAQEALAEFMGIGAGLHRSFKRFGEVLRDPVKAMVETSKGTEALQHVPKIGKGGRVGESLDKILKAAGFKPGFDFGEVTRSTFRVLAATDAFFKELNRSAEVYARVTRAALNRNKYGRELVDEVGRVSKQVFDNPDDFQGLMKVADRSALLNTFQEPLQGTARKVGDVVNNNPGLKLIVPFFKTPVNLYKSALRRVPGAAFLVRSDLRKGGSFVKASDAVKAGMHSEEMMMSLGRQIMGGGMMYALYMEAAAGNLSSGAGISRDRKRTLMATGWKPYAMRFELDDKSFWLSYRGFEPYSSWFRAMADVAGNKQGKKSLEDIGLGLAGSYMTQFGENPFLTGVHDVMQAFTGDVQSTTERIANVASAVVVGSTIPVIMQQWGRVMFDPTIRRGRTTGEKILARIPGPSKLVKPSLDVFGKEIERFGRGIPQALAWDVSVQDDSKLAKVIRDIRDKDGKAFVIGLPSRKIKGTELNDDEYYRLVMITGKTIRDSLDKFVRSEMYGEMDNDLRFNTMKKIVSSVRDKVKMEEFEKYYKLTPTKKRPSARRGRSRRRRTRR